MTSDLVPGSDILPTNAMQQGRSATPRVGLFCADRESPRYPAASLPAGGAAVDARRVPPVLGRGSSPFSR